MDFLLEYGGVDAAPWAGGMSPAAYTEYIGSPGDSASLGGSDWLGSISSALSTAANVYGQVKTTDAKAKMMTQYSPYGGYYVEGMPAGRYPASQVSPLLLLVIGGALLFALKD